MMRNLLLRRQSYQDERGYFTGQANQSPNLCYSGTKLIRLRLNAQSANGGVKTSATASGFSSLLDYSLKVDTALDSAANVNATCNASTLKSGMSGCTLSPAGAGLSSGGKTATSKTATLTIAWTPPVSPRLVAGSYSDTVTLSIAAAQ